MSKKKKDKPDDDKRVGPMSDWIDNDDDIHMFSHLANNDEASDKKVGPMSNWLEDDDNMDGGIIGHFRD